MNGLNTSLAMINADLRTLARDNFLATVAGLTGLLLLGISIAGIYRDALGLNHLQPWIPYILIMFLISNVATYGMLFGLVFVEEVETRVRAALAVIPVTLFKQTLIRTMSVFFWLIIQPVLFAGTVAAGWDAVPFGVLEWFFLSVSLAPLGAVFMIVLSTVASNRVEALAMGKFFSAATIPPMLLYLIAEDAWYRSLFLIFPTTPAVEAFEAFRTNDTTVAILWLVAGVTYALALGAYAMRRHIRKSYMISA
ncbi:MAG: hypothetical protein AAF583_05055 [Pseudomonadota bacterium]